jgi:hypothetical protein
MRSLRTREGINIYATPTATKQVHTSKPCDSGSRKPLPTFLLLPTLPFYIVISAYNVKSPLYFQNELKKILVISHNEQVLQALVPFFLE